MPLNKQPNQHEIVLNEREQIQYLLGNPPSWMMRHGITSIAVIFLLLLYISYLIHYPDVVEARIILTTENPPIRVVAPISNRISDLLVREHEFVAQGQILAVMENSSDWHDVLHLEDWLNQPTPNENLLEGLQLGNLQSIYSTFSQHWKDFRYFSSNQNTIKRIDALLTQIDQLEKINFSLSRQKNLQEEEFRLADKERIRQGQLKNERLISDVDYEKTEMNWLQQKRLIESSEATILQNQMQIKQLQNQIKELQIVKSENANEKTLTLEEDRQRLRSAIEEWKQNNLVRAPISGSISLSRIWSDHQNITAGDEILAIIPGKTDMGGIHIIGKATLSNENIAKVQPGNRAVISIDAYPAQQYGSVEGTIGNISEIPQKEGYSVDVIMPDSLTTMYGKVLPFRQELAGQVRIITEDRRVIERIFEKISDLLKNR
jgi:multidrug resistance efflux pump